MKWKKSTYPGVRYYEHESRKFNRQKDKNFHIRYYDADKVLKEEPVGWLSEGVTAESASKLRGTLKYNIKHGLRPQSLADMRAIKEAEDLTTAESVKQEERENIKFGEVADQYLEWSKNNKKSYKADLYRYRKHLKNRFSNIPMKSISPFELEKLKISLKKKQLSPATASQVLQLIRAIFHKGTEWGLYQGKIPKAKFPKLNNQRVAFLTVEQTNHLLDKVKERSFQLWCQCVLSIYAGLRFSEIASLEMRDVNLDSGTIHIRDPKSGYDRHAYVTEPIRKMFDELWAENGKPGGLIFPDANGKKQRRISPTFARIVKELGFNQDANDDRQKIVFHSLRHTFGSQLAMNGVSLQVIKELLGHQNIETTMRYSHLLPDIKRGAVKELAVTLEKISSENTEVINFEDLRPSK